MSSRAGIGVIALVVSSCLGACANAPEERGPASSSSSPPSPATPSNGSLSSETLAPAESRAVYRQALGRWRGFIRGLVPITARGEANDRTAAFYKEFFHDWEAQQAQLEQIERNGVTFGEAQTVSWYRPAEVTSGAVSIDACVVAEARAFKDGEVLPAAGPGHPYVLVIELTRADTDDPFRIDSTTPEVDRDCDE